MIRLSAILFVVLASCANPCTDDSSVTDFAHESVRSKLRAPSTAIFHEVMIEPSKDGDGKVVKGKVEAENALGGKASDDYWVKVKCKNGEPFIATGYLGANSWGIEHEAYMDSAKKAWDALTPEQQDAQIDSIMNDSE